MTLSQQIQAYVVYLLEKSSKSVNSFAKSIGISQGFLSEFLNTDTEKTKDISTKTIEKIANGFGKDTLTFLQEASDFSKKKLCLSI